jgi:hypothetical protein
MRKFVFTILALALTFSGSHSVNAAVIPGLKCSTEGLQVIDGQYRYICVKSPGKLSNIFSKKLIWKQASRITLESLTKSSEILGYLKTMELGYWKQNQLTTNHIGRLFVSNYPCYIYMSPNRDDMIKFWNYHVNAMFYKGRWAAIESQKWIINDVSSDGGCIRYFTNRYGGRIIEQ